MNVDVRKQRARQKHIHRWITNGANPWKCEKCKTLRRRTNKEDPQEFSNPNVQSGQWFPLGEWNKVSRNIDLG